MDDNKTITEDELDAAAKSDIAFIPDFDVDASDATEPVAMGTIFYCQNSSPGFRFAGESLVELGVPHVDQYFGPWAIYEPNNYAQLVGAMDLKDHIARAQAAGPRTPKTNVDVDGNGIAVIEIDGPMTKHGSSLFGGGTIETKRQIRNAARDAAVKGIVLKIDSPGGTVAGTQELGDEVSAANKRKPVTAFISDLGASAAFWVASQAGQIFANKTALVGSIGTFSVIHDFSAVAEREGVKVLVFKAGDFKGAGVPGTEITEEQQAEFQRIVDVLNAEFLKAVSKGRKMNIESVRSLADGRIHIAGEATKMGLIDGVSTFDAVMKQASTRPGGSTATGIKSHEEGGEIMGHELITTMESVAEDKSPAASYDEIVAECMGADETFICTQLSGKATIDQARNSWMVELLTRAEASDKRADDEVAKANKPGVDALDAGGEEDGDESGDPVQQWDEAVAAKIKDGMTYARAVSATCKENPDLHKAMLHEYGRTHEARPAASGSYGRG